MKNMCNVVLTSFRSSRKGDWYFGSESSRHMIGEKTYLSELKSISLGKVTFGDGVTRKIIGKGKTQLPWSPFTSLCHAS